LFRWLVRTQVQAINAKADKADIGAPGLREMSRKPTGGAGVADLVYLASAAKCAATLSMFRTYKPIWAR